MNHKRMSRRRPSKSGTKLGVGGPLDGIVELEGKGLLVDRLHGRFYLFSDVVWRLRGEEKYCSQKITEEAGKAWFAID